MSPNLLMFGREINMPVHLVYGVDCISSSPTCPVEWIRQASLENFDRARECWRVAARRQKRKYDKGAAQRQFSVPSKPGSWQAEQQIYWALSRDITSGRGNVSDPED